MRSDRAVGAVAAPPADLRQPLVVTGSPDLLDDCLRLAAAARVDAAVAGDVVTARAAWSCAPLVLVGADVLDLCARSDLARRRPAVVIARQELSPAEWESALRLGADGVYVLPFGEDGLVRRLGETADRSSGVGDVVCAVGGCGGAGASMLAATLAVTAARSGEVATLVDLDTVGGGADLLIGAETASGLRWPALHDAEGRLSGPAIRAALPSVESVAVLAPARTRAGGPVWGGVPSDPPHHPSADPVPPEAALSVVMSLARAGGTTVIDLPRWAVREQAALLGLADLVCVVCPADVRAAAASMVVAGEVRAATARAGLVVRSCRSSRLDPRLLADLAGLPLITTLGRERGLAAAIDRGELPGTRSRGPLLTCARRIFGYLEMPSPAAVAG
ncbi:MAG: septum site-determining protein Ssd [Mycobacteriales bacterium]